ncbi:hypothetical protein GCM10009841_27130 [Microlunatus panaciterrae]
MEERLGRSAVDGMRHLPDGGLLQWRQVGVKGLQSDPQLPFFIQWLSGPEAHPSNGGGDIALVKLEIAGEHQRVDEWLGGLSDVVLKDTGIDWVDSNAQPGIVAAHFDTPRGRVRI